MGPLRGDGNRYFRFHTFPPIQVEKMGPLRGDGNFVQGVHWQSLASREDGSPSWGRKSQYLIH